MKICVLLAAVLLAGCGNVMGTAPNGPAVTASPTPYVFDPSKVTYIYPSSTPTPGLVRPISCSTGVRELRASASALAGNLVIKVVDQSGHPVACAWAHIVSGNYGIGGMTDDSGTIVIPLSSLPRDDHFVDTVQIGGITTAFEFRR